MMTTRIRLHYKAKHPEQTYNAKVAKGFLTFAGSSDRVNAMTAGAYATAAGDSAGGGGGGGGGELKLCVPKNGASAGLPKAREMWRHPSLSLAHDGAVLSRADCPPTS
jgi:hypothetical protein